MIIFFLLVVCAANGIEPNERREQSFEEGGTENNERLL